MFIGMFLGLALTGDVLVAGKPAPTMSTDSVVKGKDVKTFEKGKVYVVEFWATWCPPCRTSIPHMTELQKKHPEITVIGVAGFERPMEAASEARLKKVTDFVTTQGAKMEYTVLFDSDGTMNKAWMDAAKQSGIPCAFVIDGTGTVSYVGYPEPTKLEAAVVHAQAAGAAAPKSGESKSESKSDSKKDAKKDSKSDSSQSSDSAFDSASDSQSSKSSKTSSDKKSNTGSGSSSSQKSSGSGSTSGGSSGR